MSFKRLYIFLFFIPLFFKTNLNSTDLNPTISAVYITSITYTWNSVGLNSYNVVISTKSDFSSYISSQTLSTNTTTYIGLKGNTSYYFEVKIDTESDLSYSSTFTVTYTQTPYNIEAIFNLYELDTTAQIVLNFPDENAPDTLYTIRYSTASDFSIFNDINYSGTPPFTVPSLLTNTTYYFRIKAYDRLQRSTSFSTPDFSTQTITRFPDAFYPQVYETSVTFKWSAINGLNENSSAGYSLEISNKDNFDTIIDSWTTNNNSTDEYSSTDLIKNTIYYYKFSVLNSIGVPNQKIGVIYTLTSKPSNFSLINFSSSSAKFRWDPFPPSPPSETAKGYRLEASTDPDFTITTSSSTSDITISTLSINSLEANTTYYFRVGALNFYNEPNYSQTLTTTTLSVPIDSTLILYTLTPKSIKATFPNQPKDVEYLKSYGYQLDASTTNFEGGIIYSSFTSNPDATTLLIEGLRPNTTYYLRLATFNRMGVPNYSQTSQVLTPIPEISPNVSITYYSSNTLSVFYSTNDADGYVVELSTSEFFQNISYSSTVYSNEITTITISPILIDTVYYVRLGSLFEGATVYKLATPFPIRTLTPPPINPSIDKVNISSITVVWGTATTVGYCLEASTSTDFSLIFSSTVMSSQISTLSVSGLTPNTSYYLRVGSINSSNEKNYVFVGTTSTLANYPTETPLTNHTTHSMQINWNPSLNPDDTIYLIEISSTNFTDGQIHSSQTTNNYAYFDNLQSNTTYYKRITAINRNSIPTGPISFQPIATLAFKPINLTFISSTHTIEINWDDPNNADQTPYLAEISSTCFIDSVISSYTLQKTATFYNLNANTVYCLRISALNFSGMPSEYERSLSTTYVEIPKITTPTFINVLLDGFTAQWDNNTNSTHTIYIVEASTHSDFSYIFRSTQTNMTTFVFPELNYNTQYYIRIKAKGIIENNESDYQELGSVSTLYRQEQIINNKTNQIVSIPYSYGSIEVEIPPYSLGSVTKLFIEPDSNPPPPISKAGNLIPTGFAAKIYIFPIVLYNGVIKVKIPYTNLPPYMDKNKLVMARYDEDEKLWVPLKSYLENNYVIGETYHFSIFQIMQFEASKSLSEVKIYPNPYKPNTNLGKLNFSNMPANTDIYIYTITGELVKKLKSDEKGFVQWDAKNSSGRDIASGVYLAIFKKDGKKVIKKIAIEK